MPAIAFRLMAVFFTLLYRFKGIRGILEKVGIEEGQTVLDFGCGPGHYTVVAGEMVGEHGRVYALDIHPLAAKSVEAKARKKGLTNIDTITCDEENGLLDRSVDVALLYDVIQMIKDKDALFKELHRVLKTGGVLSLIVEHVNAEDILDAVGRSALFSLRDRDGKFINLEKR